MKFAPMLALIVGLASLTMAASTTQAQVWGRYQPTHPGIPYLPGGTGYAPPHPGAFGHVPGGFGGCRNTEVAALADRLARQADEFVAAYSLPSASQVPERRRFLSDARNLRNSADRLRQSAGRGDSPSRMLSEIRRVESNWQRLESRMFRVSRGQIGPNIATALQMGQTVQQIRTLL